MRDKKKVFLPGLSLSNLLPAEHSLKGAGFLLLHGWSKSLRQTAWRLAPLQEIGQIVRSARGRHGFPRLIALVGDFRPGGNLGDISGSISSIVSGSIQLRDITATLWRRLIKIHRCAVFSSNGRVQLSWLLGPGRLAGDIWFRRALRA
jgi:hypothetical protein